MSSRGYRILDRRMEKNTQRIKTIVNLLAAGLEQKYLTMVVCKRGTRHARKTRTLRAQMGMNTRCPSVKLRHHEWIFLRQPSGC